MYALTNMVKKSRNYALVSVKSHELHFTYLFVKSPFFAVLIRDIFHAST